MSEGLVAGEGFAVDASVIKADANRANVTTPQEPEVWPGGDAPSRAVRDYLTALDLTLVVIDK